MFIDETAVKTNLTRLRGRAPIGERFYSTAPFGKWRTQTFIAGLTQNALIAPCVIAGAMNGPAFDTYIETQLAPALDLGTVVIVDNLTTHKTGSSSRWPSQSSRHTCDGSVREPSAPWSKHSATSAISSIRRNAGSLSKLQDMPQIKYKLL